MQKENILGVHYLRGLAALGVVLCHYGTGLISYPTLSKVFNFGQTGIYVFFMISGFIISYSLQRSNYKPQQFFKFLLKRSIRIDPAYIATILLTLLLFKALSLMKSFHGTEIPFIPGQFLSHIFYIVPFTKYPFYNHIFWTLCVEFQFYLLIGLIYFLSNKPSYKAAFLVLFSLSCFIPVGNAYYVLFTYAPIFSIGISLLHFYDSKKLLNLILPALLFVLVAYKFGGAVCLLMLLSSLLIILLKLKVKMLSFFGTISYSLYLTHGLVLIVVLGVFKKLEFNIVNNQLLWLAIEISIALIVAFLFYTLIEKPSLRLSKRVHYKSDAVTKTALIHS